MHEISVLIILIVIFALTFDFINGFHDTANAIATVVSTRVLTPRTAILMSAALNLVGAFFTSAVAKTISGGLVTHADQTMILAAIIGAIVWNLITWYFGIPSSSSHALVGGLIGAAIVYGGAHNVIWISAKDGLSIAAKDGLVNKVILPLIFSPLVGGLIAFVLMTAIYGLFAHVHPRRVGSTFRALQVFSAAFMSYSHGSNDAQKSMGIITLALVSQHLLSAKAGIPPWVIVSCATAMALGTAAGGWRIIKTMGHKIIRLEPVHGFAAETSASIVILLSSHFGAPVSTTHVISGSIFGVGAANRLKAVRWGVAQRMVIAWGLTIPAAALVAGLSYQALMFLHM